MPSNITIINECEEIADSIIKEEADLIEAAKNVRTKKVKGNAPIIDRLKSMFKEHLKKIGKSETVSVEKIAELNNKGKMPTMIKHCVVAVQPKLKSEGKVNAFIGAHNICYWSFQRHGLVNKNGAVSSRGGLREKFHKTKSDPGAGTKTQKYNKLFNRIFKK